jgi:hypothetical protein
MPSTPAADELAALLRTFKLVHHTAVEYETGGWYGQNDRVWRMLFTLRDVVFEYHQHCVLPTGGEEGTTTCWVSLCMLDADGEKDEKEWQEKTRSSANPRTTANAFGAPSSADASRKRPPL